MLALIAGQFLRRVLVPATDPVSLLNALRVACAEPVAIVDGAAESETATMFAPRSSRRFAATDPAFPYPGQPRSRLDVFVKIVERLAGREHHGAASRSTRPSLPPDSDALPVMTPGSVVFSASRS